MCLPRTMIPSNSGEVQAAAHDELEICKHCEKTGTSEKWKAVCHVEPLLSSYAFSKLIRQAADLACYASSWSTHFASLSSLSHQIPLPLYQPQTKLPRESPVNTAGLVCQDGANATQWLEDEPSRERDAWVKQ